MEQTRLLLEGFFMKFGIWVFFQKLLIKIKFHWNLTRITGTLLENRYTFFIISRSCLLRMRNISDKIYRESQNTHFMSNIFFNRAVYEIKCKNIVESDRPQMTMWHLSVACWILVRVNMRDGVRLRTVLECDCGVWAVTRSLFSFQIHTVHTLKCLLH